MEALSRALNMRKQRLIEEVDKGPVHLDEDQLAELRNEMNEIFDWCIRGFKRVLGDDEDASSSSPSCTPAARSNSQRMLHQSQRDSLMGAVISPLVDPAQCQGEGSEYERFDEMSKGDGNPFDHNSVDEHELFDVMPVKRQILESKLQKLGV